MWSNAQQFALAEQMPITKSACCKLSRGFTSCFARLLCKNTVFLLSIAYVVEIWRDYPLDWEGLRQSWLKQKVIELYWPVIRTFRGLELASGEETGKEPWSWRTLADLEYNIRAPQIHEIGIGTGIGTVKCRLEPLDMALEPLNIHWNRDMWIGTVNLDIRLSAQTVLIIFQETWGEVLRVRRQLSRNPQQIPTLWQTC